MEEKLIFLSTKFNMPLSRANYVRREQLLEKLKEANNKKITVIKGSAGSGKSTLVSSYIQESELEKVVWITLDEDNNDSYSFWAYLLEGIKAYIEDEDIFSYFKALINQKDIYNILNLFINKLCNIDNLTIVLDDFQYIENKALVRTINYFLKHFPENIHIIIITRAEPKIYLSELLMQEKILRIENQELKLSRKEEELFLKNTVKNKLALDVKEKILSISEGWLGGLQLITIAINSKNEKVMDGIKPLNKYMLEYLSREILSALNEKEQQFLINTSVLAYFNVDIAEKLLGENCFEIIEKLLQNNMFIINIGEGKYRYHSIFKEFLKLQFYKKNREEKESICLKAYEVYKKIGDLEESLNQLMYVEKYENALELIEDMGQNSRGWMFLKRIPIQYFRNNKEMMLQRIFYYFCTMELDLCKSDIIKLKAMVQDNLVSRVLNCFMAMISSSDRNILKVEPLTYEEIKSVNLSSVTKAIIMLTSIMFFRLNDNYKEALKCSNSVIEIGEGVNNVYIKYFALTFKGQLLEDIGRLNEAYSIYKEVFELHEKFPGLKSLEMNTNVGVAGIYIKKNQLKQAEKYLNMAYEQITEQNEEITWGLDYNLMELKILQGRDAEAKNIINKLFDLKVYTKNGVYKFIILKYPMYLNMVDKEKLEYAIKFYDTNNTISSRLEDKIIYCRAKHMLSKDQEALELLQEVLKRAREEKLTMELIYASILSAVILLGNFNKNKREILNHLREAIYYAYENNILSPFLFEGKKILKPLLQLLSERYKDITEEEKIFIKQLTSNGITYEQKVLSRREEEVIKELCTGASNKEIGERLCISVATVKTHIINIYSKLEVSSRVEAIEKARVIGIVK